MTFEHAFETFILKQKVLSWVITSGAKLHQKHIQETMILNPEGVPIARDTEDLRPD